MLPAPLAISMGEPAGIGPDLILECWRRRDHHRLPPFLVVGDPDFLASRAKRIGLDVPVAECDPAAAAHVFPSALPVMPLAEKVVADCPGEPDPANAAVVIEAIRRGVELVHTGACSALVTAPIAKAPLLHAGFAHPGHTDYLGVLAGQFWGTQGLPVMLLWSPLLAVVPVTVHIPLAEVSQRLTKDLIVETARVVACDMRSRFGIDRPRLAIAGLNPHAGESGTMGREEIDTIIPAIEALRAEGIDASGPWPADTMFHPAARENYDVALGAYHDQVLVPLKTLAFDSGVNATLGLPFVRTSPDHGTAYSLAGTGKASPRSFIEALLLAGRVAGADRKLAAA